MKIGMVCPYDLGAPGGVQDQVLSLARWLGENGHEVTVVGPGEVELEGFVSVGEVTVIPANGAATPLALSRGTGARTLAALENVDIAHLHEPLMPLVSLTALRRARVPLVGTFHAAPTRIGSAVYSLGRPLTGKWLSRLAVKTAVSEVAAAPVPGPVRLIPNAIDTATYRGGRKRPGRVMFLGRDDERKGLGTLLRAWPAVIDRVPDAQLAVVGADAGGRSLSGVRFVGRVAEADKKSYLEECEVFCAPNLGGESFGIVVLEAMAAGCAPVVSGLRSFVRLAGDAACYVPPGDADGLGRAIAGLLEDAERRDALGAAAAARSLQFDRATVVAEYLSAYAEALAAG
jgi:phosphatidylinositol alpha-mannosyltransferase